jgi:hypothetical protein
MRQTYAQRGQLAWDELGIYLGSAWDLLRSWERTRRFSGRRGVNHAGHPDLHLWVAPAVVHDHPVRTMVQDLQMHGQCRELALDYLPEVEVIAYLTHRFGGTALPEEFARFLHRRTTP